MGREIGGIIAQFNALGEGGGIFSAEGRAAWTAVGDAMKEDAARAREELDKWQAALVRGYNQRQGFGEKYTTTARDLLAALREQTSATSAQEKADKAAAKAAEDLRQAYQKQAQALADIRNKEYAGIEDYMAAESLRLAQTANASEEAVRAAQDEYDNHGKLQSAIAETTLARLQDQLASKTAGTEAADSLARQISAQQRLIDILKKGEARDAAEQGAKDLAEANRKAAEESSRYWEDALMRAFESGKGFFESLWDTIKNTLKTQVLKVLVSGVMGGGATSALAGDGSALGALGSLSGLSNLYTGVSNLVGIGGQVFAGTMSAANALGTVAANATGTGISGLLATNGAYGTAGGVAGSAGSMFAAAAPWLAGAAALYAIAQATKGETRAGGQYGYSMDGTTAANVRRGTTVAASGIGATYLEGPSGGDPYASDVSNAINSTVLHINSLLSAVGSKAALTGFQAAYETSENDRGGVLAGGTLSTGALFGESGRGDNYAGTLYDSSKGFNLDAKAAVTALSLDLKQATIEALQAAGDMPQAIADMIKVEAKTLTDEAATAILTSIDALVTDTNALRGALNNLPFAYLRDMSFDTAAGLIKAAGGLQAFDANLSGYYDNFYTASEKTANLTRNVTDALAAQNIVMPAGRHQPARMVSRRGGAPGRHGPEHRGQRPSLCQRAGPAGQRGAACHRCRSRRKSRSRRRRPPAGRHHQRPRQRHERLHERPGRLRQHHRAEQESAAQSMQQPQTPAPRPLRPSARPWPTRAKALPR
jgi:hypothetical protein